MTPLETFLTKAAAAIGAQPPVQRLAQTPLVQAFSSDVVPIIQAFGADRWAPRPRDGGGARVHPETTYHRNRNANTMVGENGNICIRLDRGRRIECTDGQVWERP